MWLKKPEYFKTTEPAEQLQLCLLWAAIFFSFVCVCVCVWYAGLSLFWPLRCGAQAPDAQAQQPWLMGPATPRHVPLFFDCLLCARHGSWCCWYSSKQAPQSPLSQCAWSYLLSGQTEMLLFYSTYWFAWEIVCIAKQSFMTVWLWNRFRIFN